MNVVLTVVLALQMLAALGMIGLILVQHGKGADMGAAFGSGGSGSLFGASGSANFLSRGTGILATVFFACTLLLAYFGNAQPRSAGSSVLQSAPLAAPAVAASGAAQIPSGAQVPASAPVSAAKPAAPASGAGQIPTK
jgi:preprotein translocase subunit SecG